MTGTMRGARAIEMGGGWRLLGLAALLILPVGIRALAPTLLAIAEILLGIAQACVTYLRAVGV